MEGDEHLGFRRAHGKREKEIEQTSVRGEDVGKRCREAPRTVSHASRAIIHEQKPKKEKEN